MGNCIGGCKCNHCYSICNIHNNKKKVKGGYSYIYTGLEHYVYHISLKNPHGLNYIYYNPYEKTFMGDINIQDWLSNLYIGFNQPNHSPWTHWIVYNDEPPLIFNKSDSTFVKPPSTAGHCKGILAWNDNEMSWLIHSVPCFPDFFCPEASGGLERVFSEIRHSEQIYGQSFGYFYLSWEKEGKDVGKKHICELLNHIRVMEPCIYISKGFWDTPYSENWQQGQVGKEKREKGAMELTRWVGIEGKWEHYAKSPHFEKDFYEELAKQKGGCRVESWIRGQKVEDSSLVLNNAIVYSLKPSVSKKGGGYEKMKITESQDHSKWAISSLNESRVMDRESTTHMETDKSKWVMIGDLNRMHSQWKRGGGGMMIWDADLRQAWNDLIIKT
jgi:deoxyribonuclease-2